MQLGLLEQRFFNRLSNCFGGYISISKSYTMDASGNLSTYNGLYTFVHQNDLRKGDHYGTYITAKTLVKLDKELMVIRNYKPFFKANKNEKRIIRKK